MLKDETLVSLGEKQDGHHRGGTRALDSSGSQLLAKRLAVDATAAFVAASAISPIMTVIDRAVVESAAGQFSLFTSARRSVRTISEHPWQFLTTRSFGAMMLLYVGTYFAANSIDTATSFKYRLPFDELTSSTAKLTAVTSVNIGLALNKDSIFARSFGTATSRSRRLPAVAYVPFLMRDAITLYATFNLPTSAAPLFPDGVEAFMGKLAAAQLVLPVASQFVTTPLHLLGLDLYYRYGRLGVWERWRAARSAWLSTSFARACRILPAYGVGGILNNQGRSFMMNSISS